MTKQDNLTAKQSDYAVFLPAISGFYATFVGKQRNEHYVDPARFPQGLTDMEQMNWLNSSKGLFPYKWSLYSGGHANLDLTKQDWSEDMVRNREPGTFILGDSGGFQIAKGLWEGEWRDPTGPEVQQKLAELTAQGTHTVVNAKGKTTTVNPLADYQKQLDAAQKKRDGILRWLDGIADYGMILDIPTWVIHDKKASRACGITTLPEAVAATKYNNLYFMAHRRGKSNGGARFLNVLQGETHDQADDWYQQVKDFCDTKIYGDKAFNGWGMGGQNMCDIHLVLKRLVALRFDGLLEQGQHDWMHFLGTSKLEWAVLLTDIQRAVRKYHNPSFTISFDCASPFLATANGQIYINTETEDRTKWVYRMQASADDKKYATDTRLFKDAVLQDLIFEKFETSPIIDQLQMKDICIYALGDLNKNGKEGKTSWDSFSYALMMGHNVWMHLNAVQEANRQYDSGKLPAMLVDERFDRVYYKDIVDAIFACDNRNDANAIVEHYSKFWMTIIGTRGATGKKTVNAHTKAEEFGIPNVDFSDLKIIKNEEPVVTTFDSLFE